MSSESNTLKAPDTNLDKKFSNYGHYTVSDELTLSLPNTKIKFKRLSNDKYSYSRENTQSGLVENLISVRTKNLEIEFVPSFPIHVPAYRTDFVFLKLIKPIFISMKSSTEAFVPVPIENAIFFSGPEVHEHVDVFSCTPNKSRFALYGPPENGKLCKHAMVQLEYNDNVFEPFLFAKMKVIIENELETGFKLGKIIFPVTNHELYYKEDKAIFDTLRVNMWDRLGVDFPEIDCEPISLKGWGKAPRHMEKTKHEFSMDMGFD